MALRQVKRGRTGNMDVGRAQDTSSSTGGGLVLAYNTASLVFKWKREFDAAWTTFTCTQGTEGTNTPATFISSNGFTGAFHICFPDAMFSTSDTSSWCQCTLQGAANLLPVQFEYELIAIDNQDAVHLGLSALPNPACTGNASLLTSGTGTDQLSVTSGRIDIGKALGTAVTLDANNVLNVSAKYLGGTLQTARDIGASVLLSAGTGTGQLDFTSGVVKSNLTQALGNAVSVDANNVLNVSAKYWAGTALGSVPPDALFIRSGTAQAGGASTITLDAGASATDNFYRYQQIVIRSGTGANQAAIIASYVGSTKVATITGTWATNPDVTSVFTVIPEGKIAATVASADLGTVTLALAQTFNMTGNITGNLSGSVGSVTGAVGSVTGAVTVGTNNDKTGYTLTQAFPTNFSSLSIDGSGRVDIGKTLGTAVTLDANNVLNVSVKYLGGTLQTARDIGASVLLSPGTGTGQITLTSGCVSLATAQTFNMTGNISATTIAVSGNVTAGNITISGNFTSPIVGNITGNLSGSVGSVTGAVGSVTSGVTVTTNNDKTGYSLAASQTFNMTGNVTGNVSGSVGSVTGAVGSVTGSVGSVVANVTIGGYAAGQDPISMLATRTGTVQATDFTYVQLDSGASSVDNFYTGVLLITSNTGVHQFRIIESYTGADKRCHMPSANNQWATVPGANAATFAVLPFAGLSLVGAYISGQDPLSLVTTGANKISVNSSNQVAIVPLSGTQTFNLTGNITGNLSGAVGSVTGAVGSVTGNVTLAAAQNAVTFTSLTSTGNFTAGNVSVGGTTALGAITGSSLAVSGNVTAGNVTVSGTTALAALTTTSINNSGATTLSGLLTLGGGLNIAHGTVTLDSFTVTAGSITANITGNLSGSVGSVTGAVGSVTAGVTVSTNNDKTGYALSGTQTFNLTGNITGNLSGSVGSVLGGVTVSTNNDKGGYALSATGLDGILTTAPVGSAGNFRQMVVQLWRRFFRKAVYDITAGTVTTYADDGVTPLTVQTSVGDSTQQVLGPA